MFGLGHPEHWSGCKQLIDFLDDLFNLEKSASVKFLKPHKFVVFNNEDQECLAHYLELVLFECCTLWEECEYRMEDRI